MTTRNSDLVANLEATPQVANLAGELHGSVRIAQGNVALLDGDSTNGDVVMLAPIPSNATIVSIRVGSDGLGGSCTYDIGIYTEAANLNTTGQQLYTMAGDSSDPGGFYYIAATFDATGGTAGDMAFVIEYVVN